MDLNGLGIWIKLTSILNPQFADLKRQSGEGILSLVEYFLYFCTIQLPDTIPVMSFIIPTLEIGKLRVVLRVSNLS